MRTRKQFYACDLCEQEIDPYYPNSGNRMLEYMSSHQHLVIDDQEFDVCPSCCIILDRAMRYGVIDAIREFLKERVINA